MLKSYILIGIVFLAIGCSTKKGNYYFNFDEVDHYSIKITEDELYDLEEKENLNEFELLKIDIIIDETPEKITDTLFIPMLKRIGFEKKKVSQNKFPELNEIFREKSHDEVYALSCIHYYRDILIFKKSNSIIGIAKICFECLDSRILGTNANTIEFGQSGDYGKLNKLLNE